MAKILSELAVLLNLNSQKFQAGIKDAKRSTDQFAQGIKLVGGAIAAAFSVSMITDFVKASLEGLDQQQKAEAKLLTALKGRRDIQQVLIADASRLQKMTLFGDETTIEAYAQLAAFVKNEESLKRLMPLVQDMATAMGMDLTQAAMLVGKAIGSGTNALARYGIEIEGAVGSSERLDSAVASLTDKFQGQATAAAGTTLGAVTQLKNAWGDFGETLATVVAPSLSSLARGMTDVLTRMNEMANEKSFSTWEKFLITFAGATGNVDALTRAMEWARQRADDWDVSAGKIGETNKVITGTFEDLGDEVEKAGQKIEKAFQSLGIFQTSMNLHPASGEDTPFNRAAEAMAIPFALPEEENILDQSELLIQNMGKVVNWASIAEESFNSLGQAMAAAFQKGANFGEIFLQLLIKIAAMVAMSAIGGVGGNVVGSVIGSMGSTLGGLFSGGGGGGMKSNFTTGGGNMLNSGSWVIRGEDLVYVVNKQNSKLQRYR